MTSIFSRDQAKRFYDRFGAKQDAQGFYEDAAFDVLIAHGDFARAHSVLEIGCGTGRLAARLLSDHLPASTRYVGIDISDTMVGLARTRLKPWAGRCAVHMADQGFDVASLEGPFDRLVSTYVFDLLSRRDTEATLAAAHAVAASGALLCTAGLTNGTGPLSRATSALWTVIHRVRPSLVGGCRPLVLGDLLPVDRWHVEHRQVVVSATVPSEVLVARAV